MGEYGDASIGSWFASMEEPSFGLPFMEPSPSPSPAPPALVHHSEMAKRAKLAAPRWTITKAQLRQLEAVFEQVKAPSLAVRQKLATQMGVSPRQIQVWFRNRRQRVRLQGMGGADEKAISEACSSEMGGDEDGALSRISTISSQIDACDADEWAEPHPPPGHPSQES